MKKKKKKNTMSQQDSSELGEKGIKINKNKSNIGIQRTQFLFKKGKI